VYGDGFDSHRPLQNLKNLGRCLIFHFSKTSTKPRFFSLKPLSALFRTIIKSRGTNILVESFRAPDQRLWLTSEAHEASDVEFKIGLMALHQEVRDSKPRFVLVAVSCVQRFWKTPPLSNAYQLLDWRLSVNQKMLIFSISELRRMS
jgi:hypothetical protein